MASRSIRVEFVHDSYDATEVAAPPEVHDVSVPDGVDGTPRVLENPHVDFPGTWVLEDEDAPAAAPRADGAAHRADTSDGGVHRYRKASEVAGTSGTAAG